MESRLKELGFEWNVDFNNIEGAVRGARAPAPPRALHPPRPHARRLLAPPLYQLRPPFTMAPNRISRRTSSPKARPGGVWGGLALEGPPRELQPLLPGSAFY